MKFRLKGALHHIFALSIVVMALSAYSHAQFTVSLSGIATDYEAPATFTITATISNGTTIDRVVFYRNDIAVHTDTTSAFTSTQTSLGQDTFTFRARAYYSGGWIDSPNVKTLVDPEKVVRMGDVINGNPTQTPGKYKDHTEDIQMAVDYLGSMRSGGKTGGTLFFPCTRNPGDPASYYNIKTTITVPSNVTLQGESSESTGEWGKCGIYWHNVEVYADDPEEDPCVDLLSSGLRNNAMFKVIGGTSRVRFRDLWLYSRSSGIDCWPRGNHPEIPEEWERIEEEKTIGIQLDGSAGDISDIILENVSVTSFTHGISATTCEINETTRECGDPTLNKIHDIKMRAVTPGGNFRQLYVNATYAYDFDIQNFNIPGMGPGQGGVEIVNAGKPTEVVGENMKLKFLQLNCNGNGYRTPAFCVKVEKHGGLYFKQLHHEGVKDAIFVENIGDDSPARTNPDPIVFDASSSANGEFKDASMKLYVIGSGILAAPQTDPIYEDTGRMRFTGDGAQSTVADCGDIHGDRTDTEVRAVLTDPPGYDDWRMQFSHMERSRSSFFVPVGTYPSITYTYNKEHTTCPKDVSGFTDINEVGGEHFNSGVMPTLYKPGQVFYSNQFGYDDCDMITCLDAGPGIQAMLDTITDDYGAVYIDGVFTVSTPINVPTGRQIIGAPESELILNTENASLFKFTAPTVGRLSGMAIRNLRLTTSQQKTTAIGFLGLTAVVNGQTIVGGLSDLHLSGLDIDGFVTGINNDLALTSPMLDGVSLKGISIRNAQTAAKIYSQNTSNWNIIDLTMESSATNAIGWDQNRTGDTLQNVSCTGTTNAMKDCIKLTMSTAYITGFKKTQNVTNAITVGAAATMFASPFVMYLPSNLNVRNSDLTGSTVNLLGRAFIVSMNNKYGTITADTGSEAKLSRLTYCGDTYPSNDPYPALDERHYSYFFAMPMPTRVGCGEHAKPWEDTFVHGGQDGDVPLTGNFFGDTREDPVVYRSATNSKFFIRSPKGDVVWERLWGISTDVPLTGRFFASTTRSQIGVFRNGAWWLQDPDPASLATGVINWGTTGDIPIVGNFTNDSDDKDDVAIYRHADTSVWIANPRGGTPVNFTRAFDPAKKFLVGDFQGKGFDQIAQYEPSTGVWSVLDPTNNVLISAVVLADHHSSDIPVPGEYLPTLSGKDNCTQIGTWRPSTGKFIFGDGFSNCGTREEEMYWGSNNELGPTLTPFTCYSNHARTIAIACADDIPLVLAGTDGLARPTAYRPTHSAFYPYTEYKGQWWIHDAYR